LSTSEILVASLRGTHVAALVSLFGTLVFLMFVAPVAMAEAAEGAPCLRQSLLRLARASTTCALIIAIGWLLVETAVMASADSVLTTLRTSWSIGE
jgi:hypothetical protein